MAPLHTLARLIVLGVALAGCCGDPGVRPPDGGTTDDAPRARGILRLGEGEREFRAIEDGDTLAIAQGCQGSQHVWLTLQAEGMDPRGMIIELSLERVRDETLVSAMFRLRLSFTPDSTGAYSQLTGITLQIDDPSIALEEDLILRARIEDRNGVEAFADREVRVAWGTQVCETG